ncbi:MAG TPA: disulfide oxidoreductase [Phycisphaeraceae bacterium]|nr:disulfide oxidoreductase [Phycisphaeraceae bacterium]
MDRFTFSGDTTVRDTLHNFPQTRPVFDRYGMCPDCSFDPPPVPLAHFSQRHNVDLEQLINELEDCCTGEDETEAADG